MKYFYYSIQVMLLVLVLLACKKLSNDGLDEAPVVLKAPLEISVVNDDDQLPVVGVKVIISRKTTASGTFTRMDTIRTDQAGKISYSAPYPNYLKVELDTSYYHKGEELLEFTTESGGKVNLHTTPKFGMAVLDISVTDAATDQAIPAFSLAVSSRAPGKTDFMSSGPENADASGKLMVSLPYPNDIRVAVGDTVKYFPDTLFTALKNVRGVKVALKAVLKPLTVPLEVTVLDKDNGTPLADVSIAVLHKLTGQPDFKDIGLTGLTDKDGKLLLNAPFSGEVKIRTTDALYNTPDSVVTSLAYEKNRKVTLRSKALTPKAPVEISMYDQNSLLRAAGVSVKVSYKRTGQAGFTVETTGVTDDLGKLLVNVPFSGEMMFEVANDPYFTNKAVTAQNVGAGLKKVDLPLSSSTAKYPEPLTDGLQVSTLVLNNGISLNKPTDVVADKVGNVYICDQINNRIVRVSRTGNTTVVAGSGTSGSADGVGTAASFGTPWGMVADADGTTLYVSDGTHKIRKLSINPTTMVATVTTIAGSGAAGTADGNGIAATFNRPAGMALDQAAGLLYIIDYNSSRVRKLELNNANKVSTVTTSLLYSPVSIALNPAKTQLYVGAFGNTFGSTGSQLIKYSVTGTRVGLRGNTGDNFNDPSGLFVSAAGKVFVANDKSHSISQMIAEVVSGQNGASEFSFIAGSATFTPAATNGVSGTPGNTDGSAAVARFTSPWGIKYNTYTGTFLIADQGNNSIRLMKSNTIN